MYTIPGAVGGLPTDLQPKELEDRFVRVGAEIKSIEMRHHPDTGAPRGFAYVDIPDEEAAMKCVKAFNHTAWRGKRLRVEAATEYYLDRIAREKAERDQPQSTSKPPSAGVHEGGPVGGSHTDGNGIEGVITKAKDGEEVGVLGSRYLRIRPRPGDKTLVVDTRPTVREKNKKKRKLGPGAEPEEDKGLKFLKGKRVRRARKITRFDFVPEKPLIQLWRDNLAWIKQQQDKEKEDEEVYNSDEDDGNEEYGRREAGEGADITFIWDDGRDQGIGMDAAPQEEGEEETETEDGEQQEEDQEEEENGDGDDAAGKKPTNGPWSTKSHDAHGGLTSEEEEEEEPNQEAEFNEDAEEEEGEDEEGQGSPMPVEPAVVEEEEDEVSRAMKEEVGQSLGIMASILAEVQAKEKAEAERAKVKAQRRAQAVARAAVPVQPMLRYDPTKPDAHSLELEPATTTATTTTKAKNAPSPPAAETSKERAIDADLSVLSVIFQKKDESVGATTTVAAPAPSDDTFSFGFSLEGPTLPDEAHLPPPPPSSSLEEVGERDSDDVPRKEEADGVDDRSSSSKIVPKTLVLWPSMEELEEIGRQFFASRKIASTDNGAIEQGEAWKASRQLLIKDFKRKRRNAVKMRNALQKKDRSSQRKDGGRK